MTNIPRRIGATTLCGLFAAGLLASIAHSEAPVRDENRRFSKRVCSWQTLQRRNIVMQSQDYSCGAAALATIIKYHLGDPVTEKDFLRILDKILTAEEIEDRVENGLALSDLRKASVRAGYNAAVARMTLEKLFDAKVPLLVGIDLDGYKHFVVYRGFDGFWVYLADPIRGNLRLPAGEFADQWQKHIAMAVAKRGQKPITVSPLTLSAEDVYLGQTNRLLIQTRAGRGSIHEPMPTRH